MAKKLIRRFLPTRLYDLLRQSVRRRRQARRRLAPKISEAEFREILVSKLGVTRGRAVFVHSSMDWMNLDFPAHRVLLTLREAVGTDGAVLFPCTHILDDPRGYYASGGVFDAGRTPTVSGLIPELARRQTDAVRSLHPTHSVVGLGKHAHELVCDHTRSVRPFGPDSPYFRILDLDGVIIGLGVSTEFLTFLHCVEDVMEERFPVRTYDDEILEARVRDSDGCEHIARTLVHARGTRRRNAPRYMNLHVAPAICGDLQIGAVPFFSATARSLLARMEELANRGVTIYSCHSFLDRIR